MHGAVNTQAEKESINARGRLIFMVTIYEVKNCASKGKTKEVLKMLGRDANILQTLKKAPHFCGASRTNNN